jgi:hypothetical protein
MILTARPRPSGGAAGNSLSIGDHPAGAGLGHLPDNSSEGLAEHEVRDRGRGGQKPNEQVADPGRQRDHNRDERPDDPQHLKPSFELSEQPALVGRPRIALHQRIEGQLAGSTGNAHEPDDEQGGPHPADKRGQDADNRRRQQGGGQYLVLAQDLPQLGRDQRPGKVPESGSPQHEAIARDSPLGPEGEGQQKREEPDDPTEQAHGGNGEEDAVFAGFGSELWGRRCRPGRLGRRVSGPSNPDRLAGCGDGVNAGSTCRVDPLTGLVGDD